jgi:hypothetical protein
LLERGRQQESKKGKKSKKGKIFAFFAFLLFLLPAAASFVEQKYPDSREIAQCSLGIDALRRLARTNHKSQITNHNWQICPVLANG